MGSGTHERHSTVISTPLSPVCYVILELELMMDSTIGLYEEFLAKTKDQTTAAVLTLAEAIRHVGCDTLRSDEFAHNLCMGIRKGLFGVSASEHSSIESLRTRDE